MRVCYLHGYGLNGSGSAIYAVELAAALGRLGHDVTLLCHETRDRVLADTATSLPDDVVVERLPTRVIPTSYLRPELAGSRPVADLEPADLKAYRADVRRAVEAAHREAPFDLVLVNHLSLLNEVAADLRDAHDLPFVSISHGTALHYVLRELPAIRRRVARALTKADAVVALNPSVHARITTVLPELEPHQVIQVAPGVDVGAFVPGAARRDAHVAFVGRMTLDKGVHCLLAALPDLREAHPDLQVHLVGDGPDVDVLRAGLADLNRGDVARFVERVARRAEGRGRELVTPLRTWRPRTDPRGVSRHVTWHGYLGRGDTAAVLAGCRVSVLPSIVPEAFPLTVLESMACGTRPVSSDHSGQKWLLEQVEGAVPQLAGKLRAAMSSARYVPNLVEQIDHGLAGANALQAAQLRDYVLQRHTWEAVATSLQGASTLQATGQEVFA